MTVMKPLTVVLVGYSVLWLAANVVDFVDFTARGSAVRVGRDPRRASRLLASALVG
jgi:hypothetical protein